jgi:hypothetical protein
MKKNILLHVVLMISTVLFSQDDSLTIAPSEDRIFTEEKKSLPDPVASFEIEIRACFTSGEFKQFYPKRGMGGLGTTVLFPVGKKNPLDIGFGFGYYWMSVSEETFSYYAPETGYYDVESRVSGGMIPLHLVGRVYPLKSINSPIQPYVEGLAGFRIFSANQRLETYISSTDTYLPVEKDYNFTASWSYGYGGGVKVRLSKNELLFLNAKITQLYGTTTKTMDPSSVVIYDDGTYSYSYFKSRTDVLRFTIGMHVMIE